MHHVHLGRVGVEATRLVAQHRAVFPTALPELVDQRHVFVRQVVAVVVGGLSGEAHRARSAVEIAGDDVPADAPPRQMVEGRHAPSEQKRRFVGEVGGHAKTQVLGGCGHGRDQHQRVVDRHLHGATQGGIRAAPEHVVHAHHVGKKDAVKQPGFELARVVGPVVDVEVAGRLVARVGPQALLNVAHAVHVEGIEMNLAAHAVSLLRVFLPAFLSPIRQRLNPS